MNSKCLVIFLTEIKEITKHRHFLFFLKKAIGGRLKPEKSVDYMWYLTDTK